VFVEFTVCTVPAVVNFTGSFTAIVPPAVKVPTSLSLTWLSSANLSSTNVLPKDVGISFSSTPIELPVGINTPPEVVSDREASPIVIVPPPKTPSFAYKYSKARLVLPRLVPG
jgi:hypothetical protein